ncbi:MAG: hypothetical protein M3277_12780 [Actinomycetota bacterium]|nr:hypothetical protein [Actinomycetota bacterium]
MTTRRVPQLLLAGALALAPLAACDKEDRADVREGVNDAEDVIDDQVDTDGKDD